MTDLLNIGPIIRIFVLIDMFWFPDDLCDVSDKVEVFFDYTFSDQIKTLLDKYFLSDIENSILKSIYR